MKEIRLENFRCYTDQIIKFRSGINLLIGDNASGKTSILKACKYVLSAFFAGFSDENTRWINPSSDDFQQKQKDGIIMPELPVSIYFNINDSFCQEEITKSVTLFGEEVNYCLRKNSKKNSRALIEGIKEYKSFSQYLQKSFYDMDKGQTKALPLFVCFSTEDIHSIRKINESKFKQYGQKNSFGYYECLDGNGFLKYWQKRMLVLQEGKKSLEEIDIVRQAIIKVLGVGCSIIKDVKIRPIQKNIYYILEDDREVEAEQLSDGYRRLVNIVTDLAFRCALLNRSIYGLDACEKTRGTVLIDEIDMHLHPSLQSCILNALHLGFPNIQFVATTHAPMVMSGVKNDDNNIVYKLKYSMADDYTLEEIQTYGLDVSTISKVILHQTPRTEEIDKKLMELFNYIDEEKTIEAKTLLHALQQQFGDKLPELARAEAMLNFMLEE